MHCAVGEDDASSEVGQPADCGTSPLLRVISLTTTGARRRPMMAMRPKAVSRTSSAVPGQRQDGVGENRCTGWSSCSQACWKRSGRPPSASPRASPASPPSLLFAVAALASFADLAYAMKGLPVGTAYAFWVGIGAALTAGYLMC